MENNSIWSRGNPVFSQIKPKQLSTTRKKWGSLYLWLVINFFTIFFGSFLVGVTSSFLQMSLLCPAINPSLKILYRYMDAIIGDFEHCSETDSINKVSIAGALSCPSIIWINPHLHLIVSASTPMVARLKWERIFLNHPGGKATSKFRDITASCPESIVSSDGQ